MTRDVLTHLRVRQLHVLPVTPDQPAEKRPDKFSRVVSLTNILTWRTDRKTGMWVERSKGSDNIAIEAAAAICWADLGSSLCFRALSGGRGTFHEPKEKL